MSVNAVFCIDCAMCLSAKKKDPSVLLLTKDERVAKTVLENQILNLGNQYHKDAT